MLCTSEENLWFGNRAIDLFHPTFYSLYGNDKVNECKITLTFIQQNEHCEW